MAGKSPVTATQEQETALRAMAAGSDRAETDRAHAILLTLPGWTSALIREAFGAREDRVRLWGSDFLSGGVEALKKRIALSPVPVRVEAALWVARASDRKVRSGFWINPMLKQRYEAALLGPVYRRNDQARRGRSRAQFSKVLRKKGVSAGDGPDTR